MSRLPCFNSNLPWFVAHLQLAVRGMFLFFGADCLGLVQAALFTETQLCEFAFLKADLLAEKALSLVW